MRVVLKERREPFDLNSDAESVVFDVGAAEYATVEVELLTGSWGSAVLAVQDSISGARFESVSGGTISSGTRLVRNIDVRGIDTLAVTLTAKAGAAATARVWLVGKAQA
jgi:hypothetical protein